MVRVLMDSCESHGSMDSDLLNAREMIVAQESGREMIAAQESGRDVQDPGRDAETQGPSSDSSRGNKKLKKRVSNHLSP